MSSQCGPSNTPSDLDTYYNLLIGEAYALRAKRQEREIIEHWYKRVTESGNADEETKDD